MKKSTPTQDVIVGLKLMFRSHNNGFPIIVMNDIGLNKLLIDSKTLSIGEFVTKIMNQHSDIGMFVIQIPKIKYTKN